MREGKRCQSDKTHILFIIIITCFPPSPETSIPFPVLPSSSSSKTTDLPQTLPPPCMDAPQWPQGGGAALSAASGGGTGISPAGTERRLRPLNCPRCDSTNTKFCYYNNYSLSQPRHFCKTCRRYWTAGGSLRNVPVGGGTRKNKRAAPAAKPPGAVASSSSAAPNTSKFGELQERFSYGAAGLPELEGFSNMELLRGVEMEGGVRVYSGGFGVQEYRGRGSVGLGFPSAGDGGGLGVNGGQGGEPPAFGFGFGY